MNLQDTMMELMTKDANQIHNFENRIEDTVKNIQDSAVKDSTIKDAYGNSLLSIGNEDMSARFSNYTFDNDTLNWPLWLALYNESWIFRRAIDKPSQDCIRCGIQINGVENTSDIQRKFRSYYDDMIQLLQWGALFGGSVAVALFDNFTTDDYSKSLDVNKIKNAKSMKFYVTDRWYGLSPDYDNTVTDMKDPDYGKPKYYSVTMADGKTYRYHHDYIIRYEHRFAPKLIKNGMLQGWGYSEGSHILNELARDEKLKTSIQSLVDKALIEVIKMDGMRGIFMGSDKQNEEQLRKRLEMVNWGRSFNSLTFLDTNDEYEMKGFTGLTGLSDLLQQNMWQIAAAVDMQGILFGDMKQGFSTDSDALERYAETIMGRCESYVRPVVEKLLKYIYIMLGIDKKIDFEFVSLLEKKHKQDKITSVDSFTNICSKLLTDGVIDTIQYAKALKTFIKSEDIDFDLTDENINKLKEREIEESEDFDLDKIDIDNMTKEENK